LEGIEKLFNIQKIKIMDTLLLSAIIGVVAGIIDIIPMVIQKLDKRATVSAFLQYFFVSIIIVNMDLPHIVWWLQGGLISVALAVPGVVIVAMQDKKAVPIILSMAAVLGTLIGVAGHFLK
jgi:hypothetical protein